jgi:hypothetical protein
MIQDIIMKPVHDIIQRYHHWPGDVSHSIDQPEGRVHGQVKLATMFSKVSPESKATSKAEYTNTQQDLPD